MKAMGMATMRESGSKRIPMREKPAASGITWWLGLCAAALLLAGCGDFWQNPAGTSTSTGTTPSSTTLTASPTSVTTGASVTLTATVSPAAATGTVNFLNSGAQIGTGELSSGSASYTATFATEGTETLTASYSGDSTYASSTSAAVTVTVTEATGNSKTLMRALTTFSAGRETNLVLDPAHVWSLAADSSLHNVARVVLNGGAVQNIDGDEHCLYYSGTVYFSGGGSDAKGVYPLSGGGYLAPTGTPGLCN
jgi:hypothetical protein